MHRAVEKHRRAHAGQSLLEVIVALAIFALISAAMMAMATGSFISLQQGGEQTEAEALAQEGIEAVRAIRDRAWNEIIYTTSSVSINGNEWLFDGEGLTQTIDQYTRTVSFDDVCRDGSENIVDCPGSYTDVHSKKATVTVSWDIREGIVNQVQKITYLTNWDSREWVQSDWVGSDGQSIWSDITKYDNAEDVLDVNTGEVKLDQTTDISASTTWPFDTAGNYTYATTSIEVTGGAAQLVGTSGSSGDTSDDGFEYTTSTSYDWPFTTAGNYTYDTDDIEVTGGVAQLVVSGGVSASGDTTNDTFDADASGWTYNDWDQTGGEVDVTGSWQASGGNPNGWVDVNFPTGKLDELGGYWEQSFTTTEDNPTATVDFDWLVSQYAATPNTFKLYVFVDSSSGAPTIGQEVWSSSEITSTESWTSVTDVDVSSQVTTAGIYYIKIAVWLETPNSNMGPFTIGYDNAKLHWEKITSGSYPTSTPDIYPSSSYSANGLVSWDSFTETATKNGGEIYYQLSEDDGITWQYWNGSSWATAGASNYNTASVVNTNVSSFSTSTGQLKFKAFLESDGTQLVQLDNVNIGLTPPSAIWSFGTWDVAPDESIPTGVVVRTGGNPTSNAQITIPLGQADEVGGYFEQAFTTTEDNPTIDIDFDYKVIDFNGTPNLSEIRVYADSASGEPVNQVGDAITVSAEGDWASAITITSSTFANAAGTYYFKIAYWVETPAGSGAGPFTIGFDNLNLDWQAVGYPIDRPTIRNSSSFTPAAVETWNRFTETATKNSGEIYYQLSNDDGSTWQYWDGDSWETITTSTDYNRASTVNTAISYFDTSAKRLMFKAFLESDGTQQVQLDNIELQYDVSSLSYTGNQFIVASTEGAGVLSKDDDKISLRFTAKNSKTVSAVRVYLEQEKGTSPIYRYGLQSNSSGEPSGTWIGASNQGYGDYQATSTAWQTVPLTENVTLTAGAVYHLVVEYQSGTINSGNSIELRHSGPANFLHAKDSTADLESNILFSDDGDAWEVQNHQPIYAFDFTDASYEGNPYHELSEHEIWGDNYVGQQFTPASDIIVSTMGMYVSENNEGPEGDVFISLYDVTEDTLLATSSLATAADLTINVYSWEQAIFDQPVTLSAGKEYRLYVSALEASAQAHYLIRSVYHDSNTALNSINYGGVGSFFISSIDGGGSWDTTATNEDFSGFRFAVTIFHTLGYVISSAYDMGSPAVVQIMEWDQITPTCSPACEVKLQIQTAPDDGGSPGTWSSTWCGPDGEDGDDTDFFTVDTGELIHTDHNWDRWIRYKATLVGDSTDTPTFEEIRVNYK